MKRTAFALLVLGILMLIVVGAYLFLSRGIEDDPGQALPGSNPFGFLPGRSAAPSDTLSLTLEDGSTVMVPDFTKADQPAWASESVGYQVAGDDDEDFLITYLPGDQFGSQAQFLATLSAEPLGEVRARAEAALKTRLGIPESDICELDVQVWTPVHVNASYAGYDLGLSFCPGATVLP